MKTTFNITFICFLNLTIACHSEKGKLSDSDSNKVMQKEADRKTTRMHFLDSVLAGADFTWKQMQSHTLLDKKYFIKNSVFTGDTVYFKNSDHPIAIIRCDDRQVCLYYYMFIFNKRDLKNTDYILVKTGCDEEQDVSSSSLDYSIVNDSSFYLKHIWTERAEGKEDKVTSVNHFYKIEINGKIDSLHVKTH